MFTAKYRSYTPATVQSLDGPIQTFDEHELLDGPFAMISQEREDGYMVVHAHRDHNAPGMTFGPIKDGSVSLPRPTLWVMNDRGATVAKYDL